MPVARRNSYLTTTTKKQVRSSLPLLVSIITGLVVAFIVIISVSRGYKNKNQNQNQINNIDNEGRHNMENNGRNNNYRNDKISRHNNVEIEKIENNVKLNTEERSIRTEKNNMLRGKEHSILEESEKNILRDKENIIPVTNNLQSEAILTENPNGTINVTFSIKIDEFQVRRCTCIGSSALTYVHPYNY